MVLNNRIAWDVFVLLLKRTKIWCCVYMNSFAQAECPLSKLQVHATFPFFRFMKILDNNSH